MHEYLIAGGVVVAVGVWLRLAFRKGVELDYDAGNDQPSLRKF